MIHTIIIELIIRIIKQRNVTVPTRFEAHLLRKHSTSKLIFLREVHKANAS